MTDLMATHTGPAGLASGNDVPIQVQQTIARAIALGVEAAPTDAAGWSQLAEKYTSGGGTASSYSAPPMISPASQASPGIVPTSSNGAPQGASSAGDLQSFLSAIKQHESGGNYQANNQKGGATGAYQFIQPTWTNAAKEAGYAQYADAPAGSAPPEVQDAVAAHMAQGYFKQYGNWQDAAEAWYDPALVGQNVVPFPQAGNTETVTEYGQQITNAMKATGTSADFQVNPVQGGSAGAVSYAQAQLGDPYLWGGTSPSGFDCSGLTQFAYAKAGVKLPRTAQQQFDATMKVPDGAPLAPGDLVFFGQGPNNITHVGIYIGGGKMIDAPHTGAQVRIENYQWGDYVGATRPGDPTGSTVLPPAPPQQAPNAPQAANIRYQRTLQNVSNAFNSAGAVIG